MTRAAFEAFVTAHGLEPHEFAVGDGWLGIVTRLINRLLALGWDRDLRQCKEKFGGLRFYIGSASDACHDAIQAAEDESCRTCEDCGAPGRGRGGSWIRTLCDGCAARR